MTGSRLATRRCRAMRWLTSATSVVVQRAAGALGRLGLHGVQRSLNALAHRCVMSFLRRTQGELIARYKTAPAGHTGAPFARIAWVMWWQGEDEAPELVKMCLESLRRNLPDATVRVVTAENFHTYVDVGPIVLQRLEAEEVSITQFSDILRTALLRRHGGLWVDASVMTLAPVPEAVFDAGFYTRRTEPNQFYENVSDRRWSAWLIGGSPDTAAFGFVNDMFEAYWTRHRRPLRYFLVDYLFALAYEENIGGFREIADGLDYNNDRAYDLVEALGTPFDPVIHGQLCNSDTYFYKLNRHAIPNSASVGQHSYYAYLRSALVG